VLRPRVKNFRDARAVIAAAITDLMGRDPESVARDAITVNTAMDSGAAEHSLTAHGRWGTTITVNGASVPLAIVRTRWF
jgi:hypothetical protein